MSLMNIAIAMERHELNGRQLRVLLAIEARPRKSVREIVEAANLSAKPVVTRAVNTLAEMALVTRKHSTFDRRLCVLEITKRGIAALADIRAAAEPASVRDAA